MIKLGNEQLDGFISRRSMEKSSQADMIFSKLIWCCVLSMSLFPSENMKLTDTTVVAWIVV